MQFNAMRTASVDVDTHDHSSLNSDLLSFEIQELVRKSKALARRLKMQGVNPLLSVQEAQKTIPPREMADALVSHYIRIMEGPFRILHIPSFWKEYCQYWSNPHAAHTTFVVNLMLVMSIGARFYRDAPDEIHLRSLACQWIYTAQAWVSAPLQKRDRLTVAGLQTQCLLVLARQVNAAGGNLVWIAAGTLLRTAVFLGLHRAPQYFARMSPLQAEIRRRLWSTVFELNLQSALDSGMPPMISMEDFDTLPPTNVDDDQIDDTTSTSQSITACQTWTQTSLQIILRQSLRTRLEVVRRVNHFFSEESYDEILRLSTQMFNALRDSKQLLQTYPPSSTDQTATTFHSNLLDHLLRRFLLALHRPYAAKARHDARYYYSRKVCLDNSMVVHSPERDEDFFRLLVVGRGLFRETIQHAAITLCIEVVTQLEEDALDPTTLQRNRVNRERIVERVKTILPLVEERLKAGETNIKGYVFTSMALAQIEAMEAGLEPRPLVLEAGKSSASHCLEILKANIRSTQSEGGHPEDGPSQGSLEQENVN
ncbi:hypothetical protein VTN96DRAFT_6900 [Rasamsonia emersonii]